MTRALVPQCVFAHLVAFLALSASVGSSAAQSLSPDDLLTVRARPLSDGSPFGIPVGAFRINPGIEVSGTWDDNILRTPDDAITDVLTRAEPAVGIQSDWDRHTVFLGAKGDFGTYADNSHLNFSDYGFLASGQYDITHETYLIAALSHAQRHQDRGTLANPNSTMPVTYTVDGEQLQFIRTLGRIKLKLLAQNENVSFSDVFANVRSAFQRDNKMVGATLSYDYMPGNGFFLSPSYSDTDYDLASGATVASSGSDVRGGWTFDNARGLNLSLFGGSFFRSYETGIGDTQKPYFGFDLSFDITRLTTLSLTLDKDFSESGVVNAAGRFQTIRRLKLEHDFTEFLTGDVTFGIDNRDYVGGGGAVDRDTRLRYVGFGARYKMTDSFGVRVSFDHEQRTSPLPGDEYKDNRVFLSLVFMR